MDDGDRVTSRPGMGKNVQALPLLAALSIGASRPLGQAASAATVLSIGDGDTITVLERGQRLKVRLACIDAPETAQSPYGLASRNQLKSLLPLGSAVSLRIKAVDRYGRTVAEVISRGTINLAMVQSGQAFLYRQYLGQCDRETTLAAELQAQAKRLGVWAVPGGITRPWDFRHRLRAARNAPHGPVAASRPEGWPMTASLALEGDNAKIARCQASALRPLSLAHFFRGLDQGPIDAASESISQPTPAADRNASGP